MDPISQLQTYCLACMELSVSIAKTRKQVYYDRDLQAWRVRIVAIDYYPLETSKMCFTK